MPAWYFAYARKVFCVYENDGKVALLTLYISTLNPVRRLLVPARTVVFDERSHFFESFNVLNAWNMRKILYLCIRRRNNR